MKQTGPAPRFSRTRAVIERPPAHPGEHTDGALVDWGFSKGDFAELRESGTVA